MNSIFLKPLDEKFFFMSWKSMRKLSIRSGGCLACVLAALGTGQLRYAGSSTQVT